MAIREGGPPTGKNNAHSTPHRSRAPHPTGNPRAPKITQNPRNHSEWEASSQARRRRSSRLGLQAAPLRRLDRSRELTRAIEGPWPPQPHHPWGYWIFAGHARRSRSDNLVISTTEQQAIEIHLARSSDRPEGQSAYNNGNLQAATPPRTVFTVPWSGAAFGKVKGILHSPSPPARFSAENRDGLLSAIAKARIWIDDLVEGRVGSFSEIAMREGKVERHIRLLAPLAFVSPRIVSEIADGIAPLTVTSLAKRLAYSWAEQENYRSSGS